MKRKILLLTIGCIFTVVALATIQGYFIYNTFKLKEKEIKSEIHKELLELEDTPEYDSIYNNWMNKTRDFSKNYIVNKVKKADYTLFMTKNRDSLSKAIFQLMKKRGITDKYKAHYANYITSVVIQTDGHNDTLYRGKLLLFGDNTYGKNETSSSQGTWITKSTEKEKGEESKKKTVYSFEVKIERFYNIDNWEKLILGKMAALFGFSIALVAFVVILFYLSLRNLITQKKISDIKSDFVDNITHEFKTPIATMEIAIKTFEKKGITDEQLKSSVAIIKRQNTRLQSLFGQVKDASLSSFSIIEDTATINKLDTISEIINDFKIAYSDVKITLTAKEDINLQMDHSHLTTILVNLLDNAVKYGADSVEVTIEQDPIQTTLMLQDNGPGIPKKDWTTIFDKFYRVQKGNVHTTKGLGLGLYYVSQIIYAYKGTITVRNGINNGALFTITLPRS